MMRRWLFLLLLLATPALGDETLVSGVSQDLIQITSNYTGSDIVVFGDVEQQSHAAGRDIVVVVRGPDTVLTVRRRDRVAGIWINHDAASLSGMPAYYYLASSRPLKEIAPADTLARYGIGVARCRALSPGGAAADGGAGALSRSPLRRGISQRDAVPRPCAGPSRGDTGAI
jgi:uncharacterized protein (TIGR02186 family)